MAACRPPHPAPMPVVRLRPHAPSATPPPRPAALAPRPRPRPFYPSPPALAGFPSPATDHVEEPLDLNDLMVANPPATFFVRAQGDSMTDARIFDGDILVVDRSIEPLPGRIVVAAVDGELLVKRLRRVRGRLALCPETALHSEYRPIYIDATQECVLWGVVTGSVRKL